MDNLSQKMLSIARWLRAHTDYCSGDFTGGFLMSGVMNKKNAYSQFLIRNYSTFTFPFVLVVLK